MSTKPLVINTSSWQYKLYTAFSQGASPKKAWRYRCGVAIMVFIYFVLGLIALIEVGGIIMFLMAALSPILVHFWPENRLFVRLHNNLYLHVLPAFQITFALSLLIVIAYCQRERLGRLGNWLVQHRPAGRPIKIVDD